LKKKVILTILLLLNSICIILGQNIENIGKEKPLKINGGLSLNQIFYHAAGLQTLRSPYTYYIAGNLNFNIYGCSIPFSYLFSNQQSTFQQPFNQYGLHPTYKWITAHLGYVGMTLSPYTLNGIQFLGAGVELSPGKKFKFSAMYGRLRKAVEYDTSNRTVEPSYKRIGYGFKAGINLTKINVELMTFRSKDDLNSIHHGADTLQIYPEENIAFGANTSISVIENLKFQVEYGSSLITRDTRSAISSENIIFTTHTSTERFNAVKAGIRYAQSFYGAGISYERIDPGYRTHGSYYFNNDLENITSNFTVSLFKKKLNLGGNIGIQRDDLNHKKMSNMVRVVNAYNIGFVPVSQLNITLTYSNFKSHTNVKSQFDRLNQLTPYENLDTLNFTQISENTSLNLNYNMACNENSRQYLSFNGTYQKATEYQDQVLTNSGARFLTMNFSHNYSLTKSNASFTTSLNYSNSKTTSLTTFTLGPTISVRKAFFKNTVKNSLSASYNNTYANGLFISNILNLRLNTGYTLRKKHNINLSGAMVTRNIKNSDVKQRFTEFTVTLGYSYNF
jgi:hypothetical protein